VTVPEMGESVLEATVSQWLKKEGDYVNVGDVLVELETDKVNVEVGAKSASILQQVKVKEGGDVKVGDVLGMIDEKAAQPKAAPEARPAKVEPQAEEKKIEEKQEVTREDGRGTRQKEVPVATPVASRFARDKEVDISTLRGTGSEGRVTKADVEQYLQSQDQLEETTDQPAPLAEA